MPAEIQSQKSDEAELLAELLQKVESLCTAKQEYTGMTLELVDKKQVVNLIKDMKEVANGS